MPGLPLSRRAFLFSSAIAAGCALSLSASPASAAEPTLRAPASAPPAAARSVGFSVNSGILWESAASQQQSLDFIAALGARSIRMDLPWRWLEPSPGVYNWKLTDGVIDAARARGISVLGVLTSSPQWAALNGSASQQTRPGNLPAWSTFVAAVATRYAGKVLGYEIWNEPNAREYFAPDPDPVAYAELVRTAGAAIRGAAPSATVVAGALGPTPEGTGRIRAVPFFEAMLAAGVGDDVDAYSFHPYDNDQTLAEAAYWDETSTRQVMRMHEILRAAGLGHKRIWATEYGAPSGLGQQRQSDLIVSGAMAWFEMDFAGPMYLHHHRDQSAADGYGVATMALQPKIAAYAVQGLLAQGVPERWEATAFAQSSDSSIGARTSPVYAIADGWAQDHTDGVRYAAGQWLSSPLPVGDLLRRAGRVPSGPYANGMQDVAVPGGARIFHGATGTHLVVGAILAAWNPDLGFPVTAEVPQGSNAVTQGFERGTITWNRYGGTTVSRH